MLGGHNNGCFQLRWTGKEKKARAEVEEIGSWSSSPRLPEFRPVNLAMWKLDVETEHSYSSSCSHRTTSEMGLEPAVSRRRRKPHSNTAQQSSTSHACTNVTQQLMRSNEVEIAGQSKCVRRKPSNSRTSHPREAPWPGSPAHFRVVISRI